jgi:hypothetical protein
MVIARFVPIVSCQVVSVAILGASLISSAMSDVFVHTCSAQCGCHVYLRMEVKKEYPLITPEVVQVVELSKLEAVKDNVMNETWLEARAGADGCFALGCVICEQLVGPRDKDIVAKFGLSTSTQVKPYRLRQHAMSKIHVDAVASLVDPEYGQLQKVTIAPAASEVVALLSWLRKGHAIRDGVIAVGCYRKVKKLVFCLAEALKRMYRIAMPEPGTA